MSKIILFIATSEDGFIADKEGGVDWFPAPSEHSDDCGYSLLLNRVQAIFMGSRSFDQILGFGEWAWSDKQTFVFSKKPRSCSQKNITFVDQTIPAFMRQFRAEYPEDSIWLLGGAELAKSFDYFNLIDECIITVIRKILGEGIPLHLSYDNFSLKEQKWYDRIYRQDIYWKKS